MCGCCILHLGARLHVRDVLLEVLVEGLGRLLVREHLLEQRLDRVARVAPGHRLGEVDHVGEQQVLPRALAHLARLALDLPKKATGRVAWGCASVECKRRWGEERRRGTCRLMQCSR